MTVQQSGKLTVRQQLEEDGKRIRQQREEGRKIVIAILKKLAIKLKRPEINDLSFRVYGIGISPDQEEIVDKNGRIAARISLDSLEDAPASSDTRRKIEARMEAYLRAYCRI